MGGLLLGFALGAIAFTTQGREIGNKIGDAALSSIKKVMDGAKESTKQSSGTTWNNRDSG